MRISDWSSDVCSSDLSRLAEVRKASIGFIFQSFNLVDELSVRENVELALLYHDVSAAERKRRADEVMDKVGLAHRAKHRPSQLSGGQQPRVAVARAPVRSEEGRVGQECVSTCRCRWSPDNQKKKP